MKSEVALGGKVYKLLLEIELVKPLKIRYLTYLVLGVLFLAAAAPATAQGSIGVIKLDVSRTTVYRGYQWVEVVAYIYTGEEIATPTITKATATLSAGITMTLPLSLLTLYSPTTVVVDGVEYVVQYLLISRVFIPESAYTGKGILKIEIEGRAAGVSFSYTKNIDLAIADHRPVLATKTEAQVALERVRAIATLASALGVDVSEFMSELSAIEGAIASATERLELYGEVDEALAMYRDAIDSLASLQSRIVTSLAVKHGELERRVATLETSLEQTIKSVEDLSRSVAESISQIEKSLEQTSKASMDAVAALAKQLEDYSSKVDESLSTLATSVDTALKSLAEDTRKSTEEALREIADKVKTLDENIVKLSNAQKDLAARISDTTNTLQISLIVVALMLLASVAAVRLLK